MSKFKSNSRKQFALNFVAMLVLALVITMLFFGGYKDANHFLISYAWAVVICVTQWLGNSYIYGLLDRKYSWEDHLVKRAIYGSIALIAYSATAYLLVQLLMFLIVQGGLPERPVYWALRTSYIAIIISFFVSLVFVAVGFFQKWRASLLEAERFKAEMLAYKYEALQNQINPHFLFNSFNVLSDLVYADQEKAVDFIRQMSILFRYVLDSKDKELVPIREEMEFIEAYTSLLQTRFEDKLVIEKEIEALDDEMIVPMTLQLLIENCVKHNEISASKPLLVRMSRNEEYIKVENRLQIKTAGPPAKKTGLSNIQQQFSFFTNREIVITETEQNFSVEVPILKNSEP